MIKPKFLWDSPIRDLTPTFSGTTISGKGPENATDWRDFSYFEADSGNLDYTVSADTDIDAVSIYVATTAGTNSIVLQYESAPSTFTTLQTYSTPSGKLTLDEFTGVTVSSGRKIRFVITAATTMKIRQLVVGEVLEAEQGQFIDMRYPNLFGDIITENVISVNGSFLARNIKREERKGQLNLQYLTASWVRSTWEPFAQHAIRYPFIYQPNPRDYTTEVSFCIAEKVNAPSNDGKGDRMDVQWSLRHIVAEEKRA